MKNERHYSVNDKGQRVINKFFVEVEGKTKMYFIDYADQMEAVNYYSMEKGLSCAYGQEYEVISPEVKITEFQQKVFKEIVEDGKRTQEPFLSDTLKAIVRKGFLSVSEQHTTNKGSKYEHSVVDLTPC
mgnify:CR=1 FL=1